MNYTKLAEKSFKLAKTKAWELGHGYAGTEHLILALVSLEDNYARDILMAAGITEPRLHEFLEKMEMETGFPVESEDQIHVSPQLDMLRKAAEDWAAKLDNTEVGTEHILLALLSDPLYMGVRILGMMDVNAVELLMDVRRELGVPEPRERHAGPEGMGGDEFQDQDQRSMVERFAKDMTSEENLKKADPVIGREDEIQRVMQILCRRTKNNPALVGESGVGKTAIVEALAQKIGSGDVPEILKNKRILALDMAAMVAGTKFRGEFEDRLKKLMEEIKGNGNLILFMDEMHTLIGAGNAEGSMDAANILKPALSRGEVQMIGATTVGEYSKHIEKDGALARRFQQVLVEETTEEQTLEILKGIAPHYEAHHGVKYDEEALEAAVRLSHRYITDRFLPDKAIDLLDEAGSRARLRIYSNVEKKKAAETAKTDLTIEDLRKMKEEAILKGDLKKAAELRSEEAKLEKAANKTAKSKGPKAAAITAEDVQNVISLWTGIPLSKLAESDAQRLANMEERIHERVIGQNEAVQAMARAIRRGRLGLKDPKRPIGSFLLLGPTGVGKTELSKAVAEVMFNQEDALIRVDMSEYMEKVSVSKFIGSAPGYVGYDEGGQLSEKIRKKPYSVILFDEIEKAHPDVFNILLQVLDEGHITDSKGRKVDFKNTVIIMTSNTGARSIQAPKHLGFRTGDTVQEDYRNMKDHVMSEVKRTFRPEFLNRIDDMIVFHPLTKEEIAQIAELMFKAVSKQLMESQKMSMVLTPEAKDYFCEKGYDPQYGARPLRRLLQSDLEDLLADEILKGAIPQGATVLVTVKDGKIALKTEE